MLHIMAPTSILSQKHEDCLKRLSCHLLVLILQMFTHKNSYDLGCDVKGYVILLNMSSEVFWKGSAAVSVGSQIFIFRKCNCSTFKFQSNFSWVFQPMEMRQLYCLKTTGSNYPWTLSSYPRRTEPFHSWMFMTSDFCILVKNILGWHAAVLNVTFCIAFDRIAMFSLQG